MGTELQYSINCNGRLMDLDVPRVMGILNVTPDSFYAESRKQTEKDIMERTRQMVEEGAHIIDIGACSTRPGADCPDEKEEIRRLRIALQPLRKAYPDVVVSVDTFRASVARMCVEEYNADIINDISGGQFDNEMFDTVAQLGVPYILTHTKGTPDHMQDHPHYNDLMHELLTYFAEKVQQLRDRGQKDIIIDPGFGFGKSLDHNYLLLQKMEQLKLLELPVLVGCSRKRMIYNLLGITPEQSLNGTSVVNTIALTKGANILRVHDVKAAKECIDIYCKTISSIADKD
ncbi:MAG: dihydropteroate synthase [Bacteroidaceae bacterium]|nr:dihydropteroate synthase [Bacteroidaceae bacterium]